ncbi:hypothetical protein K469DRAFT_686971 [Zopfia rhizophila CBS 207.26]|uniref:DUF6546 domain-containing protein n=1 Tax=Zopfia rhizophila CBS 207.26 TaxID=1314779 RepID=A0A6A6E447_9PEZI|nr:hypothetical protein K469DRAFT_686971 [Zopfia rhizophila CBS 207.26]
MAACKTSWVSLASEIRLMILEALMQDGCCVARYASVCGEWQAVIEQKNFSRLKLTPSRLAGFGDMVYRQKELVNARTERRMHGMKATPTSSEEPFRAFFLILSTWVPSGSLVLDISVYSPSDSKHHFKYLHFGPDAVSESDNKQETANAHDPRHGWVNGKQVSLPSGKSINRLFEDIEIALDFWQGLPEITAVTGLLLRRQTHRRWEPRTLKELFKLLPRLQEIYYEPWREWSRLDQRWTDESSQWLIESLIPNQLTRMVLFEDFNYDYVTMFQGVYELLDAEPVRTADFAVTRALAEASLDLEHLSASFIVDARYFFQARQPTWVWNELVSLVLTSRLLCPDESHAEINDILQATAVAAMKTPRLNAMELWNGGKGLACVFRYQASESYRPARITWRGNWNLRLEPHVIRFWEAVAFKRARCEFQVVRELLDTDVVIKSHSDAIHSLKLLHQVVHPVSLWQIQKETGY